MLDFFAGIKNYLLVAALAAIVALGATILIQNARLDAKDAKLAGYDTALTSFQEALKASQSNVSELEAARVIDAAVLGRLDAQVAKNRQSASQTQANQDRLKKDDAQTRDFLDLRTPDALRRLLDIEDGVGPINQ